MTYWDKPYLNNALQCMRSTNGKIHELKLRWWFGKVIICEKDKKSVVFGKLSCCLLSGPSAARLLSTCMTMVRCHKDLQVETLYLYYRTLCSMLSLHIEPTDSMINARQIKNNITHSLRIYISLLLSISNVDVVLSEWVAPVNHWSYSKMVHNDVSYVA